MIDLVRSFSVPRERAILEAAIKDGDQPVRLIRNGDIGREPPELINLNMTANFAVLQYLAHCTNGIHPDDAGTKRYKLDNPGPGRPYGFSFDDLFRGVVAYNACARQREKSSHIQVKKGSVDGTKLPQRGDRKVDSYIKASAAHYGRYIVEDDAEDAAPENLAHQAVKTLADSMLRLQAEYLDRKAQAEAEGKELPDPTDLSEVAGKLWRRTAYMFRVAKYHTITDAAAGRSSGRRQTLDPMEQLPPIDHKNITGVIDELYARGLFKRPEITAPEGKDVLKQFRALLPEAWSIEQYIAQMERDGEVLDRTIEEGLLPEDGLKALKQHREDLKQCHATLALIPARLPIEMDYVEALKKLGMYRPEAEGDAKYTDTRIDRREKDDGTPVDPNGYSLKPGQVIGKSGEQVGTKWCGVGFF